MVKSSKSIPAIKTPTIITIFGATGDLTERKLIPSLFSLYQKKLLPEKFRIIAYSRRSLPDKVYHEFVTKALKKKKMAYTATELKSFLKQVSYQQGFFDTPESYKSLKKALVKIDMDEFGRCSNKLFHLAVPANYYEVILENLAYYGLTIACSEGEGWTRILIEKPFGKDRKTAENLNQKLGKLFKEEQIFRIDHYMAKEALQNILMFRFSNMLFEPIWNNKYIEKVEVKLFEKLDIEGRGAFYDDIGALRDVGQNHMLRMLALIAMEKPIAVDAGSISKERTQVLKNLKKIEGADVKKYTVRGQYKGYLKEPNIKPNSTTETYFKLETYIQNKRWEGVPFYMESGKAMKEKRTEITIYLKKSESYFCPIDQTCDYQNVIQFTVAPEEGISVCFWAKKPGFNLELEPKTLAFNYQYNAKNQKMVDSYERVLFDCIKGDQTFFTTTEEETASWKFITPILEGWSKTPLQSYAQGSWGPASK